MGWGGVGWGWGGGGYLHHDCDSCWVMPPPQVVAEGHALVARTRSHRTQRNVQRTAWRVGWAGGEGGGGMMDGKGSQRMKDGKGFERCVKCGIGMRRKLCVCIM